MAKAKELTMLGQPIGAKEALRIGLVNKVAPPERLMAEAEAMAREVAEKPPAAIEAVKKVSHIVPRLDRTAALEWEIDLEALLYSGGERKRRMAEFLASLKARKKG
jgi:enoyl-CoA hydratase/carnithine racemase